MLQKHLTDQLTVSADTLQAVDPDTLDLCSAVWTSAAVVVASLDDALPRDGEYVMSEADSTLPNIIVTIATCCFALYVLLQK